jgi:3-deoxy-D-manno-octulosonate 8-phosphate phosphatase (KDO 8-P phosphatase)
MRDPRGGWREREANATRNILHRAAAWVSVGGSELSSPPDSAEPSVPLAQGGDGPREDDGMNTGRKCAAADAIRLLVLDVDGVLTDGRLYFGSRGEALKAFHARDGYGIRQLISSGVAVAVISGRRSAAVSARCRELGIAPVLLGVADKLAAFARLRKRAGVAARECACVGDDLPDVPLFSLVGLSFAVADAHPLARRAADRVTALPGGLGAVREVCDRLLAARARAGRGT